MCPFEAKSERRLSTLLLDFWLFKSCSESFSSAVVCWERTTLSQVILLVVAQSSTDKLSRTLWFFCSLLKEKKISLLIFYQHKHCDGEEQTYSLQRKCDSTLFQQELWRESLSPSVALAQARFTWCPCHLTPVCLQSDENRLVERKGEKTKRIAETTKSLKADHQLEHQNVDC